MNVDHEIGLLITELQRLGAPSAAHGGNVTARRAALLLPLPTPSPARGARPQRQTRARAPALHALTIERGAA
jgi:hypothetical protein